MNLEDPNFLKEKHPKSHPQLQERQEENIVENIIEIPSAVRQKIEEIQKNLDEALLIIEEYKKNLGNDPDSYEVQLLKNKQVQNIGYCCMRLINGLGFRYSYQHLPNIRYAEGHHYTTENNFRIARYLPETIEIAFLANDKNFATKIQELAQQIAKHSLLSNYESKDPSLSYSDEKRWKAFKQLFDNVPRDSLERIKKWLLAPSARVSHSIFTHTTNEIALDGILSTGSLQSPNLLENPERTGAYSSKPSAWSVLRAAIHFDQNAVSRHFGEGVNNSNMEDLRRSRRIWLVTRGDKLLRKGIFDSETFEDRHPFLPGDVIYGSAFMSPISPEKLGTSISIEEFLIFIPEGAEDLEQKIHDKYPNVTIKKYERSFYKEGLPISPNPDKEIDITTVRNLGYELKEKFGEVKVPRKFISAINYKEQEGGLVQFPILLEEK